VDLNVLKTIDLNKLKAKKVCKPKNKGLGGLNVGKNSSFGCNGKNY
tara:strand:+ start:2224 stop:2361 length:138 start_codon:yes stop_codon:yes gene_type:complete